MLANTQQDQVQVALLIFILPALFVLAVLLRPLHMIVLLELGWRTGS